MQSLNNRVGFWAALAAALTFVVFTICFIAIALRGRPFIWTTLPAYVAHTRQTNQFFTHLAQFSMLLFAPLFVLLLAAVHEAVPAGRRVLSRAALHLGTAFATLSALQYFVQLSTVRHNLAAGTTAGLEHFIQFNPSAAILGMGMAGWTLFLGLSSLCLAFVFGPGRLERIIALAFAANGLICLLGGAGFLAQNTALVFLTMNLGLGGALLVALVALALWFRRG